MKGSLTRSRAVGAMAATALAIAPVLVANGTVWHGIMLSALPIAAVAGWSFASIAAKDRLRSQVGAAVGLGLTIAFGAALVFQIGSIVAAVLSERTAGRPETALGYLLLVTLGLVGLGPILAIPASAIGLVWAAFVRRVAPLPAI